jgi:hypothetical protein
MISKFKEHAEGTKPWVDTMPGKFETVHNENLALILLSMEAKQQRINIADHSNATDNAIQSFPSRSKQVGHPLR